MTSVRPKLKPDTPKTVTAWNTLTGVVIYMTADHGWTENAANLGVFTGDDAEAALAIALQRRTRRRKKRAFEKHREKHGIRSEAFGPWAPRECQC